MAKNQFLEINDDPKHQAAEFRFERAGWVIWGSILALAVAGFAGSGPWSTAEAAAADGSLRVEYQRVSRHSADSAVVLRIDNRHARDGVLRFWLNSAFPETVDLKSIHPEPKENIAGPDRITYVVPVLQAGGFTSITIRYTPDVFGFSRHAAGIEDGPSVEFNTLILP